LVAAIRVDDLLPTRGIHGADADSAA
jgi:hypothetical protein